MGRRGPGQRWHHKSHASAVLLGGSVYIPYSTLATPEPGGLQQSSEQCGCRRQPPASWAQQGWELPGTTKPSPACGSQPQALRREALWLPQPPKTSAVMFESPDPSRDSRRGCSRGRCEEKYCILQGRGNGGHHPDTTTSIQPSVYLKDCAGQEEWI